LEVSLPAPVYSNAHRAFAIQQLAECVTKRKIIACLMDPDALEKYGFRPIPRKFRAIHYWLEKLPTEDIDAKRAEIMSDTSSLKFMYKRKRMEALEDLYDELTEDESLTAKQLRLAVLKQAEVEAGDTTDKMAEALRNQHMTVEGSLEMVRTKALAAGLAKFGYRARGVDADDD
jgi:hypothetical protein